MSSAPGPVCVGCSDCRGWRESEWAVLPHSSLARLEALSIEQVYLPDEEVFWQGGTCEGMFCVREGIVALRKSDRAGTQVITRLVHAGESLGCRTFFAGGCYTAAAVPITRCQLRFVERDLVWQLLARHPETSRRFLKRLSQQLMLAENAQLELRALTMRARLARVLLKLADRFASGDGELAFDLPLARQDLAAMVGVRPESVARAIRSLEQAGLACFRGRRVRILSLESLEQESMGG